ncbi:MAG: YIP1 family protein [Candidatus Heimdallarchaeaceae archaeon]
MNLMKDIAKNNNVLREKEYVFLERVYGNLFLDKDSFKNMPKTYKFIFPTIILLIITALKIGIFGILINKVQFQQLTEQEFLEMKNSIYLGIAISTIPQVIVWATILFGIIKFLGGKGNYVNSLSIYSLSQLPVIFTSVILLIIAASQHPIILSGAGLNFDSFQEFNSAFFGYRLADLILFILSSLYVNAIAGFGLSSEHKVPAFIGLFATFLAFIATIVFYFLY